MIACNSVQRSEMYLLRFLFLFVIVIPSFAIGQDHVKGMKVKRMPKDYLEPTGKLVPENSRTADGEYSYWRVYSDRDNN
ncbi:MAG TPA: hypothetical protein PKK99_14150, partial [Bacteroidia bacterium]|nr:hypothetical protein [Bacteroidia bacterium]